MGQPIAGLLLFEAQSMLIGSVADMQVVYQHGAIFISSAGNAGPALSTVGAAGGTSSAILGIGAYVSPELASAGHALREALPRVDFQPFINACIAAVQIQQASSAIVCLSPSAGSLQAICPSRPSPQSSCCDACNIISASSAMLQLHMPLYFSFLAQLQDLECLQAVACTCRLPDGCFSPQHLD